MVVVVEGWCFGANPLRLFLEVSVYRTRITVVVVAWLIVIFAVFSGLLTGGA